MPKQDEDLGGKYPQTAGVGAHLFDATFSKKTKYSHQTILFVSVHADQSCA
jgi:hypothetical protein